MGVVLVKKKKHIYLLSAQLWCMIHLHVTPNANANANAKKKLK